MKTAAKRKFSAGQRIWKYNDNRRKYVPGSNSPVYGYGYEEFAVVRIERRSYLIGQVWKEQGTEEFGTSKKYVFERAESLFKTIAEKDDDVYIHTHRHHIIEELHKRDAATLRRVAEVLGYQEQEQGTRSSPGD